MVEKRSSERFTNVLPIVFSDSSGEYRGVSIDFSASGLFILTKDPFSPGTSVRMHLEISEKKTIHLKGVVVRTIKTGDINVRDGMAIKLDEVPFIYHQFLESIEKTLPQLGTEESRT